ncbi:MAG: long-chain fatty acid transport protein [Candidatus Latescibacterota bacterium]|jgi:long-chain fatty acid transport protein
MKKILLLAVFILAAAATYAGGYRVSLQGNKSLAMGNTGVAIVNSESAFFNPAGLVFQESKFNVSLGAFGVMANVTYQNESTGASAQTDSPVATPFYVYASCQATDCLAVGLTAYTPYGSSVTYQDDWAGSHLANNIALAAIFIKPTVAIKVNEDLSFGGFSVKSIWWALLFSLLLSISQSILRSFVKKDKKKA